MNVSLNEIATRSEIAGVHGRRPVGCAFEFVTLVEEEMRLINKCKLAEGGR